MASEAQIQANRKNSKRSTGPKTENGKSIVRKNALKHGGRAKTLNVMPVLPQEDPKLLEERIQAWIDDWQPKDGSESDLVHRGAELSLKLERGERIEVVYLTSRVRKAERKAGQEPSAKAIKRVNDLGRKLFYDCRAGMFNSIPAPPWDDDPAVFVAELEETVLGCRWLLDRWAELRAALDRNAPWLPADVFRLVRLLGKFGHEAVHDPALNAIFLARDVLLPGSAETLWKEFRHMASIRDPAFNVFSSWRDLGPRPADSDEARTSLRAVMSERALRLERIISRLEQTNEAGAQTQAAERLDRAAFDPSPAYDRHCRRQSAMGRELLRIIDTLSRLRKEDHPAHPEAEAEDPSWDKIPILSSSDHQDEENDRNGILSH
ncbi:MAG TPA: hypothetical protein VN648_15310, partial [Candidatus Methylomirabilis sp.]|nr:hypothetical protein [Candidatus Methylomirabilis sp.]